MQNDMFGIRASPGTTQGLQLDITYRDIACPEQESQVGVECVCWCCLINDAPRREQFYGSIGVGTLGCHLVFSLCCYFHFCCVAIIFLLSCVRLIFFKLFFLSAAITRWPYDCMRPAGEDGGLERVFIERPANTDCVAEPRSTATYIVSYRMARIMFTTCLIFTRDNRNLDPYCVVLW